MTIFENIQQLRSIVMRLCPGSPLHVSGSAKSPIGLAATCGHVRHLSNSGRNPSYVGDLLRLAMERCSRVSTRIAYEEHVIYQTPMDCYHHAVDCWEKFRSGRIRRVRQRMS